MNMSHCRFENTVQDMEDCYNEMASFNPDEASEYEVRAYERFLQLVQDIAEEARDIQEEMEN